MFQPIPGLISWGDREIGAASSHTECSQVADLKLVEGPQGTVSSLYAQ